MAGTWNGHVERYRANDGFLYLLEHSTFRLRPDGTARLFFNGHASRQRARWRLNGRKLTIFNPAVQGDSYTLYLRKDRRTLDDPGNSGNGVVFVYRKDHGR